MAGWLELSTDDVVHILPCNVPAVRIFPLLSWEYLAGPMGDLVTVGVATNEIREVANVLEYRLDAQLLADVRMMVRAAIPIRNSRSRR